VADRRLPVVRGEVKEGARLAMRQVLRLAAILVIATGCGGPGPAAPAGSVALASPAVSAAPAAPGGTAQPTAAPSEGATSTPSDAPASTPTEPVESDDAAARPDATAFLQVCGAADRRGSRAPIPCADAVEAALGAPELDRVRVARVDVRPSCGHPRACLRQAADAVWVTVVSDRAPLEIEVVRGDDDTLSVGSVGPGTAPDVPAFNPPARGRATIADAPPSVAGRPAYPLCGQEKAPMGGPYDEAGRRCFLTGVLAGSPVEFATLGAGTEGGGIVRLYRYAGTGGIEFLTAEDGSWLRSVAGIAEARGGLVFDIGGLATAREPVQ